MLRAKIKCQIRFLLLVLVSAFIFFLENPNYFFQNGLSILAWISFIPILIIVNESSLKSVCFYGGLCGFLSYEFYGYWLNAYHPLGLVIICGSYFLIYAFLFLLLRITNLAFSKKSYFIQCIILCAFEHVKTLGFFGFSYGVSGYTQWRNNDLIQISDIFGVFGISYLIIFFSGMIYGFYQKYKERQGLLDINYDEYENKLSNITREIKKARNIKVYSYKNNFISFIIISLLIILSVVYGKIIKIDYSNNKFIRISAIQNNEDPWKDGVEIYTENIKKLIKLSEESIELNNDISLIVWPETAVVPSIDYQYYYGTDENRKKIILFLLNYIENSNKSFLIGNNNTVLEDGNKKYYNSALFFEKNKKIIPSEIKTYSKNHLVPFSERFPNKKYFPRLYSFLQNIDTHETAAGTDIEIFNIDEFYFSTPICFEDTFGDLCSTMYKKGARCFVNISNDAWAHNKVCQNQHKVMALFRSVENKVPTVRSTASGQTCVIDPNGKILNEAPSFCSTYLVCDIPIIEKERNPTLYVKYGYYWQKGLIFLSVLLLISSIIIAIIKAGIRNGRKKQQRK